MARVFISHSSEDHELAGRVHQWLTDAGHEVFLDQDLRDGLAVGDEWEQRLHERLRWADAMVCLVTSAYHTSAWCAAEVGIARSRGSRLLPLLAESGVDYPLLEWSQYADMSRDPVAARAALTAALRRIDVTGGSGWPDDRSPFPGLRPFDVNERGVFFGRAGEVAALASQLRSPAERASRAVLVVVGPSGCGKSSLVRAGLVPAVADEPGWWTMAPFVPGSDPVAALTRELAASAHGVGLGLTVAEVAERLDSDRLGELADELLLAAPGPGRRHRLLLVVDQFEELLTQAAATARRRFAETLRPALDNPLQVVATLRPEFLAQLLADPELVGLPTRVFTLRPLRRDALATVIKGPAQLAGIEVDQELVDRLVGDTDTGEALPLLAFTLEQLAEGVRRSGKLSAARYEQLGGVQGALIRQADAALNEALADGGRSTEEVIAGLLRLVTVDEQGRPNRWRVKRGELPGPVRAELDPFIARRLLTTDTDNGIVVVEVTHEAFLSAWPPLAQAISAAASGLRMRRAVEHAATEWESEGRPTARLWERGQLAAALNETGAHIRSDWAMDLSPSPALPSPRLPSSGWLPWRKRLLVTDKIELSQTAREFLYASIRIDRRRRRRAATILSVLLILSIFTAVVAVNRQRTAQQQQQIATARELVAQAQAIRANDPRTALQLGIAAQRIHPSRESQGGLINNLSVTHYQGTLTGFHAAVRSVAFAPHGRILATGDDDGAVIVWDLADPTRPRQLSQHLDQSREPVEWVMFAPRKPILASTKDNSVILWDLKEPTHPRQLSKLLTASNGNVLSGAFSPNGQILATNNGPHNSAILWDLADPTQPRRLSQLGDHNSGIRSVAFAPDGHTLASGSFNGAVSLWDTTNPARPRRLGQPLTDHSDEVISVAFTRDGRTLATGGFDKTVILWDVADPDGARRLGEPLTGHNGGVYTVASAPNSPDLATAGFDGTVILWDLADPARPRQLGQALTGHNGGIYSLAFTPDGGTLATGSEDRTVILWDLSERTHPKQLSQPLTGHGAEVPSIAFAPGGRMLATGNNNGTVILWDLTNPTRPRRLGQPLIGHHRRVNSVAFAEDGDILATGSDDQTVILWDLTNPTRPRRLGRPITDHRGTVNSVAFAPRGRTLATSSSADGKVILWDLADPSRPRRLGQFSIADPTMGSGQIWSIAFDPSGHTLAVGSDKPTDVLWDVTDPTRPRQLGESLTGHSDGVISVAFAPDGRTLATGGLDRTVILWDLSDRGHARKLDQLLTDQRREVNSVTFAPNGHTLATGSFDGTAILWDVADPARPYRLGEPLTFNEGVWSTAFSPDGSILAASNVDGTVTLWGMVAFNNLRNHAPERACAVTQRGLNRDEWRHYVPGLPYKATCPS